MNISLETEGIIAQLCARLKQAERVLICGHRRPDGDCLGSLLALSALLSGMGKEVRLYNKGPIQDLHRFLPGIERIESEFPEKWPHDLLICLDCADLGRLALPPEAQAPIVNIDHHQSNTRFGELNCVEPQAAATAEVLYALCLALGAELTPEIATCLMCGIMTDTGGFRYANTRAETFELAAALTRAGADAATISSHVFEYKTKKTSRLIGQLMSSIHYECDDRLAWAEITSEMLEQAGGNSSLPDDLSAILRGIEGVEVTCLFYESPEGGCRASMRSRGRADVSQIAATQGGGGHRVAAGCFVDRPYQEARRNLLAAIATALADL